MSHLPGTACIRRDLRHGITKIMAWRLEKTLARSIYGRAFLKVSGRYRRSQQEENTRPFFSFALLSKIAGAAVLGLSLPVLADDEIRGACDEKVMVTGQYEHVASDTFLIANASDKLTKNLALVVR